MNIRLLTFLATVIMAVAAQAAPLLLNLRIAPPSFNPTIGQTTALAFELRKPAVVTARVIDRDGVPVRVIAERLPLAAGTQSLKWDGRTDSGEIVPDEAWSFRLDLESEKSTETYFPADEYPEMLQIKDVTYDRARGVLRYKLPTPSRVHLQAGVAIIDPETKSVQGPVLKTVVNRAPRAAGVVIEQWNGRDESGSIVVPDLPNFVVAVATTPLPENSVITTGGRGSSFIERLSNRVGASLLTPPHHPMSHAHHIGLKSAEDVTPPLKLNVERTVDGDVSVRCWVLGPTTNDFARQGGEVMLFIDGSLVEKKAAAGTECSWSLTANELTGKSHIIAVNWVTPNGPTAANAARVDVISGPINR